MLISLAGQILAVAFNDNSLRLFNAYSGKAVHRLAGNFDSKSLVSCLGWGVNFTDSKTTRLQLHESSGTLCLDDLLTHSHPAASLEHLKANLPRELALLDIESSLPKLSTLPSTGDEYDLHCISLRARR